MLPVSRCCLVAIIFSYCQASAASGLGEALKAGKPSLDVRLRYEEVDHDAFAEEAKGLTLRTRFGFKTAQWSGFTAYGETDLTNDLKPNDFNSTVNGKTEFPVIADPNSFRLNRLWIDYTGLDDTSIKLGRQRIKLDNDRFVGNVGWRQNEQTYDALRIRNSSIDKLNLEYTHIWRVNRIFGSKAAGAAHRFDAATHLLNASYTVDGVGSLTAYGYFFKLDQSAALSNRTVGLRFAGQQQLRSKSTSLSYSAEYAWQEDYKHNPTSYDLNYLMASAGITHLGLMARVSYELLEGNGVKGFATPLATLHAFQGFTDNFLATPASGIEEWQAQLSYTRSMGALGKVKFAAWYRDFSADVGNEDLGKEIDLLIAVKPAKRWSVALKYADYSDADFRADVSKFWFSVDYKY